MRRPQGNLSRRGFLENTAVALAATGLPLWYAREAAARQGEGVGGTKKYGENDTIRLATIGTGDRCKALINDAKRQAGVRFVAVCDVDSTHADAGIKQIGYDVPKYKDYRELLQRDDIDAVIVATPDHWHSIASLAVINRGLDVYCEKPLTLTIDEGKTLVKAAREHNTVFQTGSQQRSDARYRLACELIRNNRIGKVLEVEARIGRNPQGGPFHEAAPPAELDWNMWLGQTPEVAYIPERCHYEFRWWRAYSGGKMTDWGAHHNDITQWALGRDGSGPVSVNATGAAWPILPNCYDFPESFIATCKYENGTVLHTMSDGENGNLFKGENGWIFVNRSKIEASDPKLLEEPLGPDATRLYVSDDHMANFIQCVRKREKPICDVEVGHRSVTVCHLENIALNLRRELAWDPQAEQFVDDDEANKLLRRDMRSPWTLDA